MGDQHSRVLQVDHPVPDNSGDTQCTVQKSFLRAGEHSLTLKPGKVSAAELVIGAGHEVVQRTQYISYQLPVLGIDGPGDIGEA